MFKSFQKAFDRSTTKPITGWRTDNNKHDARVVEHEVDHTNTNKEKMSKQKDGTTKKYPTSTKQYFHQKKSPGSGMHSSEDQKKKMFDQPEGVKLYYPATNFSKVTKSLGLSKSIFRNIGLIKSHDDDDDDKDLADRVIGEDKPDLEKMGQMAAAPAAIRPASAATTTAVANPPRMGTPPSLTAPKPNAGLTKSLTEHTYGSQIKRFSNVGRNCRSCGVLVKSIDGPCPSCEGARKGVRWHEGHLA
tara:strand:- start:3000 stop:3737 length:738 start_codon:yes stop_codon:yes gene_type:complete